MNTESLITQRLLWALSLPLCLLILCANAVAAEPEVVFTISPRETWIGSPVVMTIAVQDGDSIGTPTFPALAALTFQLQPGRQTMSSMQVINGRITRENKTTMTVMVTPTVAGMITIPPVTLMVDGVEYASAPTHISASLSTAGDLLSAKIVGRPGKAWVGQPIDVTLRIFVKPFQSREHGVTLGEADMWQFIDHDRCEFGPFTSKLREMNQNRQRPTGHAEFLNGHTYVVYDVSTQITVHSSGIPALNDVRVAWNYPLRLASTPNFFGRSELTVSATKPISASATVVDIDVLPLPTEGQPASFRGAVGSFALTASAKPINVAVGDPITLTLRVTDRAGGDNLDTVQPPPLDSPAIAADFRMPTAPLAGTVQGNSKTFTQTLRPTHPGIQKIPAIEFSWFDPIAGQYRTAISKAIEIDVAVSERITTDAILGGLPTNAGQSKQLTAADGGLVANVAPTLAMVRDQSGGLGWTATALIMLLPPVACAAVLMVRRRRDKLAGDVGYARQQGARANALKRLKAGNPGGALAGYIADQINQPSGTVTRGEARTSLLAAIASADLIDQVDQLLAQAERSRFAASANADESATAQTIASAKSCIVQLEKLDWRSARAAHEGSRS